MNLAELISATDIVATHDRLNALWHTQQNGETYNAFHEVIFLHLIGTQHRANFVLWHAEDEARTPNVSDAVIADVKRRIDKANQLRNDTVEQADDFLLKQLEKGALPSPAAPLHSETPGLIIDRLSILSLKIYHTREEAERPNAPKGHAERNRERLTILNEQRNDLAACLDELWTQILAGTRRFKLYQQLKMYNDPTLNPAIYNKEGAKAS